MYLVAIAWIYVALMMALAEAMHTNGTVLGAIVTFLIYGLLPTSLVMYIMGTPLRRKARLRAEAQELTTAREAAAAQGAQAAPTAADPAPQHPSADSPTAPQWSPNNPAGANASTEQAATRGSSPIEPDASGHAPGAGTTGGVAPVGKPH